MAAQDLRSHSQDFPISGDSDIMSSEKRASQSPRARESRKSKVLATVFALAVFAAPCPAATAGDALDAFDKLDGLVELAFPSPGAEATLGVLEKCSDTEGAYEKAVCEERHKESLGLWSGQLFRFEGRTKISFDRSTDTFSIDVLRLLDGELDIGRIPRSDPRTSSIIVAMPDHPTKHVGKGIGSPGKKWVDKMMTPLASFKVKVADDAASVFESRLRIYVFGDLRGAPATRDYGGRFGVVHSALINVQAIIAVLVDPSTGRREVLGEKWFVPQTEIVKRFGH